MRVKRRKAAVSRHEKDTLETVMDIVLYYAPITCALAPYITLTEADAAFELRPLNFRKGQNKTADYLKINPKRKVQRNSWRSRRRNGFLGRWTSRCSSPRARPTGKAAMSQAP